MPETVWLRCPGGVGRRFANPTTRPASRVNDLQVQQFFGQQVQRAGETRTWWVIALTGIMMIVEVAAGVAFGSMALLADGLHMASHAGALAITAAGYAYARRHAADPRFSFGTGDSFDSRKKSSFSTRAAVSSST